MIGFCGVIGNHVWHEWVGGDGDCGDGGGGDGGDDGGIVGGNLLMTVVSRHHCKTSMKWFCNHVIASFIIFSTTGIAGW